LGLFRDIVSFPPWLWPQAAGDALAIANRHATMRKRG
jgi:hypothetical protein